jgi:lycopene beta-cyclase
MHYDLIIAGGGMAGLSLLHQLRQAGQHDLRVLVLDKEEKRRNDRTWCFWETQPGPFEAIVFRQWDQVRVHGGPEKPLRLPLKGYRYKMIRGIDFYAFMDARLAADDRADRRIAAISAIRDEGPRVIVETDAGTFSAGHVFDSTWRMPLNAPGRHHLLQHFYGEVIRTSQPVFDPSLPDLMHFGLPQQDQCRFIYVLPLAPDRALVEFTVFSESLLDRSDYRQALHAYLDEAFGPVDRVVEETEFGVIPMSDEPVTEFPSRRVIRIGTAGGYTNPATGFTFRNTQKRLAELIAHFQTCGSWQAPRSLWQKRFGLYASVMLNVLQKNRVPAPEVFYDLYRKNPVDRVFRFLDGESDFLEELKLMQSTAIRHFLLASVDVLRKRLR